MRGIWPTTVEAGSAKIALTASGTYAPRCAGGSPLPRLIGQVAGRLQQMVEHLLILG
jgi:hypothetical protein